MSHERGLVWLTRLGFAARGLLYLIIAWLAIGAGRAREAAAPTLAKAYAAMGL